MTVASISSYPSICASSQVTGTASLCPWRPSARARSGPFSPAVLVSALFLNQEQLAHTEHFLHVFSPCRHPGELPLSNIAHQTYTHMHAHARAHTHTSLSAHLVFTFSHPCFIFLRMYLALSRPKYFESLMVSCLEPTVGSSC